MDFPKEVCGPVLGQSRFQHGTLRNGWQPHLPSRQDGVPARFANPLLIRPGQRKATASVPHLGHGTQQTTDKKQSLKGGSGLAS